MSAEPVEKPFVSEKCDVYAFGSNSSSQLAMGSTEKLVKATLLPHMANCQLVRSLGCIGDIAFAFCCEPAPFCSVPFNTIMSMYMYSVP